MRDLRAASFGRLCVCIMSFVYLLLLFIEKDQIATWIVLSFSMSVLFVCVMIQSVKDDIVSISDFVAVLDGPSNK